MGHSPILCLFKASYPVTYTGKVSIQLLPQMLHSVNKLSFVSDNWHASFPRGETFHSFSTPSLYSELLHYVLQYANERHMFFRSFHQGSIFSKGHYFFF